MAVGDPTGPDLCSGTTNGNTLTQSYTDREITIDVPIELSSGTQYAIVVRAPDADNTLIWNYALPGSYANGGLNTSNDSGATWNGLSSAVDFWFSTKSGGVTKDSYNFSDATFGQNMRGAGWAAQVFIASSTYTINSIVLRLKKFLGDAYDIGTITVSIRAVSNVPVKAANPTPANAANNVTLDQQTISWENGGGATSYNVYYGTESGNLTKVSSAQAGTSFTITGITNGSPFSYLITRYWRIDSTNTNGTTTGDEWSFTTIRFLPPGPTYWYSAGEYWYQLLVQADGTYGDPPPTGVEDTDYVVVSFDANFIRTVRKLVAAANNTIWYEDI